MRLPAGARTEIRTIGEFSHLLFQLSKEESLVLQRGRTSVIAQSKLALGRRLS